MSDTEDLAAFIAARYDEAETLAKAAAGEQGPTWHPVQVLASELGYVVDEAGEPVCANTTCSLAAHIAAHDPAYRLADIALKRAILAEHGPWRPEPAEPGDAEMIADIERRFPVPPRCRTCAASCPCVTVRLLGAEFAGHPGYRAGWAP